MSKRRRPPNRLVTECQKVTADGLGVWLHTDRTMQKDGSLGAVIQISLVADAKTGSGLDGLMSEITRVLNREIQVQEVHMSNLKVEDIVDRLRSGGLGLLLDAAEEIERLRAENFALAANQCHHGYGDGGGNHRCKYQDTIERLENECYKQCGVCEFQYGRAAPPIARSGDSD